MENTEKKDVVVNDEVTSSNDKEVIEKKEELIDDDELIEDVVSDDDAPVEVLYRCKKCGQILDAEAKDCWKCSSKEIEQIVEEETKELHKVMLSSRIAKLEHDIKQLKSNNNYIYFAIGIVAIAMCIYFITHR